MVESNGANAAGDAAGAGADIVSDGVGSPDATGGSILRRKLRLPPWRRPKLAALLGMVVSLMLTPALLLLVLAGEKGGARAVVVAVPSPITYHELPEIIADLKTSHTRMHYVQLAAVVEVAEESLANLRTQQALIIAEVQIALRDLQRQDLAGSAGIERLRGMFTSIVDRHIAPASVHSVLFTKFLVD